GEIISADSMAVYKGMDIGTAKPTSDEQSMAVFHLIDVVEPSVHFSVADFKCLAQDAISDIFNRVKLPIIVGGTGLYIKSLTGEFNIPKAEPDLELRNRLRLEAEEFGGQFILQKLEAIDPETANRLHEKDTKRIIRAIEVYEQTGKPISYYHNIEGSTSVPYTVKLFGLSIDRETLYQRIEDRIDQQIKDGLVDEVKTLLDMGLSDEMSPMKGLGYKQIIGFLKGEYDFDTAIDIFKRDTRRFAKRQMTWFRSQANIDWINVDIGNIDTSLDVLRIKIRSVLKH
ncbi:MAG: tRNA (adenosine(37)-N6)-dimethylallyltransferase MiaA, partial [Armatimonadota bacterium]